MSKKKFSKPVNPWLNGIIIFGSLLVCSLLLLVRTPGMTILGFSPQWLLMWLVAWSIKRNVSIAVLVAIAVGFLHDSLMVSAVPSHIPGFVIVAWLTASWRQQRYLQEDFISLALIVFMMTLVAETVMAIQYLLFGLQSLENIWLDYQQIALASAVLSSLWAPLVCTPLVRWWDQVRALDRQ
ncbi:rod shape-determining protein MreD [[Limnothrix rosea] IAM M-220]|uniref:rod shape-determining protein MreD n=1 Tax=[Limnothrix rosea] IAM M-220 TaxID=454133 RepID=UPI0009691A7E|nr:rod shape-determining protein MreD [[Limnothrix rosea] IAM M-220]OKH12511.1 rod shape-determining protein MreD [[Limnothrix rosea] IAM M-220]